MTKTITKLNIPIGEFERLEVVRTIHSPNSEFLSAHHNGHIVSIFMRENYSGIINTDIQASTFQEKTWQLTKSQHSPFTDKAIYRALLEQDGICLHLWEL